MRLPETENINGGMGLLEMVCAVVSHKRKTLGKNHPHILPNEAYHHF